MRVKLCFRISLNSKSFVQVGTSAKTVAALNLYISNRWATEIYCIFVTSRRVHLVFDTQALKFVKADLHSDGHLSR